MDEEKKTVIIAFSQLPESVQTFHLNSAKKKDISLEEQLFTFIQKATEAKQEEIGQKTAAEIDKIAQKYKSYIPDFQE